MALLLAGAAFAPPAHADPADELPLLEIVAEAGDQDDPASAFNQRGRRFLVLYDDNENNEVEGRFVTPSPPFQSGQVTLGSVFTISESGGEGVDEPALAVSKRGNFLAVWEQFDPDLGENVLAGALLDRNGVTLAGPFILQDQCDTESPNVAYNEDADEWLVVWQQDDFPDGCEAVQGIKGVILSGDTTEVGGVIAISEPGAFAFDPDPAYDTRNREFLVAYVFSQDLNTVLGQRVGSDGALLGDPIEIAVDDDLGNDDPVVAFDQTRRRFLVAWAHETGDFEARIEGRFVPGGGGTPLGGRFFISEASDASARDPALEFRTNRYLVTWESESFPSDMLGQSIARDGTLIGGNFDLANDPELSEEAPTDVHLNLACANNQVCLALWQQLPLDEFDEPNPDETDIAGRLLFRQP